MRHSHLRALAITASYPPAVSHRIRPTRYGNALLLFFAIIYAAVYVQMTLTLDIFSIKILFFGVLCTVLWLLCAQALQRQHVGLLGCINNAWTWEPTVRSGALTHHPVVDVTLAARFDWQTGMLLRFELYETNDEGDFLGTTVLWLLVLRCHASRSAAWQDLRRAVYAPVYRAVPPSVQGLEAKAV